MAKLRTFSSPVLGVAVLVLGFAMFFAIELILSYLVPRLQRTSLQLISAAAVALLAIVIGPRLQRILPFWSDGTLFRTAMENGIDDFYIFQSIRDADGQLVDFRFTYINPIAERRLGLRRDDLIGLSLSKVRPSAVTSGILARYREIVHTGTPYSGEHYIDDDRIAATWLHVHAIKLGDGLAVTSRDITDRKRASEQASFLAHHDQLTGLANRTLLQARLSAAIQNARESQQKIAVFMIDVDNFKAINDSLGHMIGDKLLNIIGRRLLGSVRENDTVARLGGDEFVIVIPSFKDLEDIECCGEKIVRAVHRPITIDGNKISVTISTGFCIYPDAGLDPAELLKNADAAMYSVKGEGRNGFRPFRSSDASSIDIN
ncbi:MAG: diguanylate cyclase [Edaphobacter sp.]|uniref:sensor domain-containing diguanylate cyclase n=1 Tax=Edaphobacter sp. TaxID=1934404 RepID=UPI00238B4C3F|nr:sensor domain-containing diguanylate cyclase [Edaphobacter sp.]MDE1176317.1 diguanylate cyclase [Edaphobacter sp.]